MKKTALEEEILEDINRLKKLWGIDETLQLSGGFYQNYCNLSVSNQKIRKKKRQTWAGVITMELGYLPETEKEWMEAFNLTGVLPPKKFTKLRNRLRDYDDCVELEDLSDPVGENYLGEPFDCPTQSAMAYDLFKTLRVWEWFDRNRLDKWERLQFCDDGFPRNPQRRLLLVSRSFGWDECARFLVPLIQCGDWVVGFVSIF